jgi:membrane-associated protease RseP (regulator of RpoE activity)
MPDISSALRAAAAVLLVGNLLIVYHELGHFMAARCLGVRVLRFTIGFGPVLARRIDARGTVWTSPCCPLAAMSALRVKRTLPARASTLASRP